MGVYYYLCRPDTKTMFEAGKSSWSLLYSDDDGGEASVPRTLEGWLARVKRYYNDEPEDAAYQQLMAEALYKFSAGAERFWVISDAGDGVWELTTHLEFVLTGSIYYLGRPEYEKEIQAWNRSHSRYRADPEERAYYAKSWAAMQAIGEPKDVGLEQL